VFVRVFFAGEAFFLVVFGVAVFEGFFEFCWVVFGGFFLGGEGCGGCGEGGGCGGLGEGVGGWWCCEGVVGWFWFGAVFVGCVDAVVVGGVGCEGFEVDLDFVLAGGQGAEDLGAGVAGVGSEL
jgi:hypothetical protein